MTNKLSTQSYKGSRDFYPEDMKVRDFIFNNWKKVCKSYGYDEYDGPFLESFEVYAAKSGEELVNEQLYSFTDRGDRKVAIRPEMTPTLARMIAQKINELPRPIRWFSIANFWRYEKPQRGRGREFFQLNTDIFGVEGREADLEIISLMADLMKSFGANENMFEIRINNRKLMDNFYKKTGFENEQIKIVNKAIDKRNKISKEEFVKWLSEEAKLQPEQITKLSDFIENPYPTINSMCEEKYEGALELTELMNLINEMGLNKFVKIDVSTIRGLDYYTGTVFEIFDLNPENSRAIAGGGRYDDLIGLFGNEKLTGTGFAIGDITFTDFLQTWGLLPEINDEVDYFVTLWPSENPQFIMKALEIAKKLREKGFKVSSWLEKNTKIDKQLKYADKIGAKYTIIVGENELKNDTLLVKDMKEKSQSEIKLKDL
ncbi:histidine--tRNA ligase [Patescibacteria group bacterium]|nr:histidine--tRNA ligase [Patescibacteria group bacterium]